MASSGNNSAFDSIAALATSPSARNAVFAVVAAAGVVLSLRFARGQQTTGSRRNDREGPNIPDKDDSASTSYDDVYAANASRRHMRRSSGSSVALGMSSSSGGSNKSAVAIFWDVDNCTPPTGSSGHAVAQAIRKAAQSPSVSGELANRTGSIVSFKAYLELSAENATPSAAQVQLRSELQGSGVSLIDTPKSGRKDVADKMMIADLLSFAIDKRPPALIVLLSGDRDFAYPLGILRNRGYDVLLIVPPIGATPILEASATAVLRWRQDVLGVERDGYGRLYDKGARRIEESGRAGSSNFNSPSKPAPVRDYGKPTTMTPASVRKSQPPPTPPVFIPLVQVLEQLQREGSNHPKRSIVALRLRALDPKVYEKAGANAWGEYVAVAESAGIVALGIGQQVGMEWVALRGAPGPTPPGRDKGAPAAEAPANSSGNPAGYDVSLFHPLIEVWKQCRAGLPASETPTAAAVSSQLTYLVNSRFVEAYAQAGVHNFNEYMKMAEQAKVGRVVPAEGKGKEATVEIHPRYSSLHTGMIMPSNPSARLVDTSNVTAPEIKQTKLAAFLSGNSKKKDSKFTDAVQASLTKECPFPLGPAVPHQPSGEVIHAAFFPLANCLLTHRGEGDHLSPDHVVKATISKHHKTGKFVSSNDDFEVYLARAEKDDIVRVTMQDDERFVALSPRLCKGEGEDKHKGFARGIHAAGNNGMTGNDNSSGEIEIPKPAKSALMARDSSATKTKSSHGVKQDATVSVKDTNSISAKTASNNKVGESDVPKGRAVDEVGEPQLPGRLQPSAQFNTVAATAQDRARFKPLIEVLVSKRRFALGEYEEAKNKGEEQRTEKKRELANAIEPLRATVTTTLLFAHATAIAPQRAGSSSDVPAGPHMPPGAWLQRHGFASFHDLYNEAERKGFVHLVSSSIATGKSASGDEEASNTVKDRVRLAERYERMFFPSDE